MMITEKYETSCFRIFRIVSLICVFFIAAHQTSSFACSGCMFFFTEAILPLRTSSSCSMICQVAFAKRYSSAIFFSLPVPA